MNECKKHPLLSRLGKECGCTPPVENTPIDVDDISRQEIMDLLHMMDVEECKSSLSEFVRCSWHVSNKMELQWGQHIETMCWHIQQQLEDSFKARHSDFAMRVQNLLINIPPRSLKTTVLVSANAWAWLHEPSLQIMYLSANPRVAINSARVFRDLIASPWYQSLGVNWKFRLDQDALSDMGNNAGGRRLARGLDATIVGEGADWICIDDPHDLRDPPTQVRKTNEGYDSAVANRLNDPRSGIRTCIMQRNMVGDMSDHVLQRQINT